MALFAKIQPMTSSIKFQNLFCQCIGQNQQFDKRPLCKRPPSQADWDINVSVRKMLTMLGVSFWRWCLTRCWGLAHSTFIPWPTAHSQTPYDEKGEQCSNFNCRCGQKLLEKEAEDDVFCREKTSCPVEWHRIPLTILSGGGTEAWNCKIFVFFRFCTILVKYTAKIKLCYFFFFISNFLSLSDLWFFSLYNILLPCHTRTVYACTFDVLAVGMCYSWYRIPGSWYS